MVEQDWSRVGAAIQARLDEMAISKAEFIRDSGITTPTLNGYLAGRPIKRKDKERELCRSLGWTGDSIDRILRGEEPVVVQPTPKSPENHTGSEGWPSWLEDWLRSEISSVRQAVADVAERVADLERRVSDPPA